MFSDFRVNLYTDIETGKVKVFVRHEKSGLAIWDWALIRESCVYIIVPEKGILGWLGCTKTVAATPQEELDRHYQKDLDYIVERLKNKILQTTEL